MECFDWLSFQSLIQELYSARVPLKSFHTELLAQKLTRVILMCRCDVDLCAGWSTYTAVLPWKWNPLIIPVSIRTLSIICPLISQNRATASVNLYTSSK